MAFVSLTNLHSGRKFYVNSAFIQTITPMQNGGSKIHMHEGQPFDVAELPYKVVEIIEAKEILQ